MEKAYQQRDHAGEYESHVKLVELAIYQTDWQAAARHIRSLINLHANLDGGSFTFNSSEDRRVRWARYGLVWLRLGWLSKGLCCFRIGKRISYARNDIAKFVAEFRNIERPSNMYEQVFGRNNLPKPESELEGYIDSVVELWTCNMSLLVDQTRTWISEVEYSALLEIFLDLFLKELKKSWPKSETTINRRMEDLKSTCAFEAILAGITDTENEPTSDKDDLAIEFALDLTPLEHQIAAWIQNSTISSF
jgi:hypothetical protein